MESPLEPEFAGVIGNTVDDSTPWWPPKSERSGSPNVVVIVLDDVGFAHLGCYGGSIATPHVDALADGGVLYSNFHVPALCSPTRASLLTGRNHHAVGVGFLSAFDTGFPGYRGAISPAAATMAEILRDAGYGTYAVGKWHLAPPTEMNPSGPFDQWPTQRGFDRYFGFLWGEDDQFTPELWYDQHRVETPNDPTYHFSEDIVDRAVEFLADHLAGRADDPFLCYVAFAAGHAPHQAPVEFIARYAGAFDHGWDVERQRVLERQISMGIAPPGTELSPRNPGIPAWSSLTEDERRLFARYQEAFAGFMEHADRQIGRLIAFLDEHGILDDTVIVFVSDNGASGEGGRNGTINEYRYFLGLDDSTESALQAMDEIGSPATHNQYPAGWAQAGNTPHKLYKKFTHGGGVRAPLIVHWPAAVESSKPRPQFHHAIDILPTILEIVGVEAPTTFRGVDQLPVHGTSMRYSFADVESPSRRTTQYFETVGHRGIYASGWKAVTTHKPGSSFDEDTWELYDLSTDFAENEDLADRHPDRLAELQDLWWREARRYCVLPLDDRMGSRVIGLDPSTDRTHYEMMPGTRLLNHVVGPSFSERGFRVAADVELADGDEGVLLAYGRRAHGFSFFVKDGRLAVDFNLAGTHTVVTAKAPPAGAHLLQVQVEDTDAVTASLWINDDRVARTRLPRLFPGGIGTLSLQCGHNSPSAVSPEYQPPFPFTGLLHKVTIDLEPRKSAAATREVHNEMGFQ